MSGREELLAIAPDGTTRWVPLSYEGIKLGLDDATMDFIVAGELGMYLDDEGLLTGQALNVPASMLIGRAMYGPVVLAAAEASPIGDTLPAPEHAIEIVTALAEGWQRVVRSAADIGQTTEMRANLETVPPPQVVSMSEEQFEAFLRGEGMP